MAGQTIRLGLTLFLITFLLHVVSSAQDALRCPVCGMDLKSSTVSFETTQNGKSAYTCSFACAHRYHRKHPEASLHIRDFTNGKRLDVNDAFFLVKSKNLLKEVEVLMPPAVIAFQTEGDAQKASKRLGDGTVVKGFDAAIRVYE